MNGIIHHCTHANTDDVAVLSNLKETDVFLKIFQYIDRLFQIIRPRKLFYLAIDGMLIYKIIQ